MMERIDQAYETMIEVGDADIAPVGNAPEATPQLVANTLGLFAGAALRYLSINFSIPSNQLFFKLNSNQIVSFTFF